MKRLILFFGIALTLQAQTHWVGSWGTAPAPQGEPARRFAHETIRETVHLSLGGDAVRIRLSNAFSNEDVEIGAVRVALASAEKASAEKPVTFSGRETVRIPKGGVVLSDPVALQAPDAADLTVSLYIPGTAVSGGFHNAAHATTIISKGDTEAAKTTSWYFLTGVDVSNTAAAGTIVAFGDSITDGTGSTTDANRRWPDLLAARLRARKNGPRYGVVNMGIGGNRILNDGAISNSPRSGVSALARFDSDVLAQTGVRYLVVLEGINDIGHIGPNSQPQEQVTAADIIAGHLQLIARAHEAGIQVIGATLTPFDGPSQSSRGYFSEDKEKIRAEVNDWIRTSKAFDGVIDFDKAVRDAAHPNIMAKAFDSGDSLHPSDAGYQAMADAIDLALFR